MVRVKANPKYMFKILTTLSAMVLLSIIMIMGFWAATIQTTTISSTISFTATDVDVNIVGVVTGSETPVATYTTNISDKEFDTVSKSWDLGQLLFSGTTKAPIVIGLAVRNNGIDTNPYITCEVVGDVPSNVKVRYSQIGGENAIPYSQVVSANEFSSALISSFQAESSQTAVGGISIPAYNPSSTNNLTTGKVFYYQIEFSIIDFNQAVDSFNLALGMTIQSNRLPERDSVYQVESKVDSSSPTEGGNCGYEVINSTSSSSTIKFVAEVEEGYEFDGWYIKDNSDNASDRISSDPVFITSTNADVTYYAKWKKARKVSFVVDGVNKGTTNYTSGTVSDFASAYEPTPYSTGWFLNEELTQVAKDDYLSTDTETSPVTLYCRTASITGLTFTLASDGNSYLVAGESETSPSGEVVLPNKYEGKPVSGFVKGSSSSPTFKKNTNITSVVLSNNIVEIANYTFRNSTKITNVTIPDCVISIGNSAFSFCTGLTSVTIGNSVKSIETAAFQHCSGLTGTLTIPDSVTSIGSYAFNSCSGLTGTLTIPDSVTSIGGLAFSLCGGLTGILTIPNSVTSIGSGAFSGCSGLTSIVVASGNTKYDSRNNCNAIIETSSNTLVQGCMNTIIPNSVTSIEDSAFSGCSGLTSIEIPNSVTILGVGAFYNCSGLTSIEIPNSVTSIGNSAFESCSRLTNVTIGNSVKSIGSAAFQNCSGLTGTLTIPNSVTSIGRQAFTDCSGLTNVTIGNSVKSIETSVFNGCSGLTGIEIPNTVTSIGSGAFGYCTGLTKIFIPISVTTISASSYYSGIFYSCSSGLKIYCEASSKPSGWGTYWNYRTKSAIHTTYWGQTIEDLTGTPDKLTFTLNSDGSSYSVKAKSTSITGKVVIPDTYEGKPVTTIENDAFTNCNSVTNIVIPNSVTSIGNSAFRGCSGLTGTLTIPNSVTSIGDYTFYSCSKLTSITIPNSVTSIGEYTFYECSGLTSIEIPDSVTNIGDCAFEYCSGLTSIEIPDSVTNMGGYVFRGCRGLTSVTIGNRVTSIGSHAFQNCSRLTNVTIGNSVTSIGISAFQSCTSLTEIFIPKSVTTISASSNTSSSPFYSCSSTLTIFCEVDSKPDGWDSNWCYYSSYNMLVSYWGQAKECLDSPFIFKLEGDKASYSLYHVKDKTVSGTLTFPSAYNGKPVTAIYNRGFSGCTNLTSIIIPNSVTTIGSYAFSGCTNLTNVEIPDSVTNIGLNTFEDCSSLVKIYIPRSVTSIGGSSRYSTSPFYNCSSTLKIYCGASSKPRNWGTYWNYYASGKTLSVTWGYTREQFNAL